MSPARDTLGPLREVIARHWGYRSFRPLQEDAMRAVLQRRDSLVVLPTGGGKSLCYQAPAVLEGGTTVVVSPLIALMKDQVDSLRACGVSARQLDSSQSPAEREAAWRELQSGAVRLLFLSPERLIASEIYRVLQRLDVRTFAIDEAHCISHWGHDFRPEYRQMGLIREHFPQASLHGYTATATEQVRQDIISQLGLRDPAVLVGSFDRPNLTYRVLPRHDLLRQVLEVLERHPGEAGIIYCLRRRDVDDLAGALQQRQVRALPYHAGMSSEQRQSVQEAFASEECDVVVATIAFGMGIDRSNVRFVLHTALPKSLEHYQQETGRAGRDGLEAECVLLYSGADVLTLRSIIEKSASDPGADPSFIPGALRHLEDMDRYSRGAVCRHRALVQYFGQEYQAPSCNACDLCLGDTEEVPDAVVVAQKILSCVARVNQSFGIGHVVGVLRGEQTEALRKRGHDRLSTYGLLDKVSKADLRDWIYQLIGQEVLLQVGDEYPILKLNDGSWEVMRGQRQVRLIQLKRRKKGEKVERSRSEEVSWEGVDRPLFDALRERRRQIAGERGVPPYVIFSDATLRELARRRPSTLDRMRQVYGVGDAKLRDLGETFLNVILEHVREHGLPADVPGEIPLPPPADPGPLRFRTNPRQVEASSLFSRGASVEEVMQTLGRARSTVMEYLTEHIRQHRPGSIDAWVPGEVYQRVVAAVREVGAGKLRPIFIALGEAISYDVIRLVLTHLETQSPAATA